MASISGDFAKLRKLIGETENVASGRLVDQMKKNLAAEAVTQVQLGFRESRSPDGRPWAPLHLRGGKPLLDTGRLRSSFSARPTSNGIEVGTNVEYAGAHQDGAKVKAHGKKPLRFLVRGLGWRSLRSAIIPKRPMLPEGTSLPSIWAKAFEKVADLVWRKFWGR